MSNEYFSADMGALWIQPDGPNTKPQYLGCHDLTDIAQPQGDVSKRYCPDSAGHGKWQVALTSQGLPGDVTASIATYVGKTPDYLQRVKCPVPIYVHQAFGGRKDTFMNYDAGTLLRNSRFTNKGKSNMASREGSDASEQTFDLSADPPLAEYWPLTMARLTTTEAADLLALTLCGEETCAGSGSVAEEPCDELAAAAAAVALATANAQFSDDAGATWTAGAADPFAASENISDVVCFPISRTATRHLVCRGTTDAAAPAEVAYTDNGGTAWTLATVGSTNGEFVPWHGLFAFDMYHIWLGTDQGNIFFSDDGGVTWTAQTTGLVSLNNIDFVDYEIGVAVGDTNGIYLTTNGGDSWATITGPAAQAAADALAVACIDRYRWQVGYDDGELWYTHDGGDTWAQRTLPMPTGAVSINRINAIDYIDEYFGAVVVKWTDGSADIWGSIYRTFNGGYDWEEYSTDAAFDTGALGLSDVIMCDENTIYAVGDLCAATATIYMCSL